jgi:hypothetical protein
MKAQILKIAGVKNEKEFYKKFPTEEAFMKKHGKELKKAKPGAFVPGVGFDTDIQGISKAIKKNNRNTGLGMLANQAGSIVGLSQSVTDKYGRQSKELDQLDEMIGLAKKASASAPKPPQQKYVRPEDQMIQPINPLGVQGFGYFQNGGEIQNTFAPNDIYTDMGYEPLNDSNPKQYQDGGIMAAIKNPTNSSQFMSAAGSLGGGLGSLIGGSDFEQTEEGQLASTILGAAGTAIGGPVGGLIGAGIGGLAGGIFGGNKNKEMKAKRQNQQNAMASLTGTANIQNMNQGSAYVRNGGHIPSYEDGGWVSNDWMPQTITKFGDYSMKELLAPPHDADMLRAGGHLKEYTPPSARAMYTGRDLPYQMANGGQMAMGGDLKVLDGGYAETISYNPFMPGTGETVMFRGRSHDNGGIPVEYGQNGVEVEGGEPMFQMQDGGEMNNPSETNTSGVVAGNMFIPKYGVEAIGDPKAEGKKFKHYITDLSKIEAKQNKTIDKSSSMLANVNGDDQFDQLKLNAGRANLLGANMKLKEIADKKITAANLQNAILDTAKEFGLESDALAKGKIKYAKANDPYAEFGAKLEKAQKGKKVKGNLDTEDIIIENKNVKKQSPAVKSSTPQVRYSASSSQFPSPTDEEGNYYMPISEPTPGRLKSRPFQQMPVNSISLPQLQPLDLEYSKQSGDESKTNWWETGTQFANSLIPYMRPSNQMQLSPQQLSGELFALSDNTLDPVYAQTFQPDYTQPVSISYQDQLNANQADFNALQRQFGYSPEVASALAGQKYGANTKVLGEQSRANQAEQQRARETNRETANAAKLQNMNIFQNQADKMAQTKSIMKQQKIAALNSINDKYLKNQLENRQLAIGENMYNYRYSPNGVAYNVNPFAQFAPQGTGQTSNGGVNMQDYEADDYMKTPTGQFVPKTFKLKKPTKTKSSDDTEYGRNGAIVKAIKNL